MTYLCIGTSIYSRYRRGRQNSFQFLLSDCCQVSFAATQDSPVQHDNMRPLGAPHEPYSETQVGLGSCTSRSIGWTITALTCTPYYCSRYSARKVSLAIDHRAKQVSVVADILSMMLNHFTYFWELYELERHGIARGHTEAAPLEGYS
jgi:hypothetical protein